jgi:hypothetical protein
MNTFQNILVIITVALAIGFLVRKFIWKPKKKAAKSCGSDGCSC